MFSVIYLRESVENANIPDLVFGMFYETADSTAELSEQVKCKQAARNHCILIK